MTIKKLLKMAMKILYLLLYYLFLHLTLFVNVHIAQFYIFSQCFFLIEKKE